MKTYKYIFFLLVLTFTLSAHLFGQQPPDRFVSGKARFSIALPAKPQERAKANITVLADEAYGESMRWGIGSGTFASVETYLFYGERGPLTAAEKTRIVDAHKKRLVEEYKNLGLMTQETAFASQDISGAEVRGIAVGKLLIRVFFAINRLFVLTVSKRSTPDFNSLLDIVNSFSVLDKGQYAAALIAENPPKDLPQTPRTSRAASDVTENDLRGKVSRVVEQESVKAAREPWSEQNFDIDGNLIAEISYIDGLPLDIARWGWIDGMRVRSETHVSYGLGEGSNEKEITTIEEAGSPVDAEEMKKHDTRYGERYEYKYDAQNRLVEKKSYWNNGKLGSTDKCAYLAMTRTCKSYDTDNRLNQWLVQTLDAQGNIIEEKNFHLNGKLESTTVYKYEFDPKGNWTVQQTFEKKTVRGKPVLQPKWVHYREISYY